jgi:hypothetical protein
MSAALVTTDWLSFATAASSGTGTAWTDPDGARLPLGDGATLTLRLLGTSQFLDLTGVTIPGAVPAAAHLVGIEVSIERAASASGVIDEDLRLLTAGLPLGENKAAGGAYPESFAPQITGGPADPWGTSLTRAELDASFGLRIRARNTSLKSSPMAALRAARIRLSFAEPDPGPIGQTQAGLALLEASARLAAQALRRAAPLPGHAACHAGADVSSVATRVAQGAAGWKVLGRLQRRRVRPCPCLRRSRLWLVSRLPPAARRKVRPGWRVLGRLLRMRVRPCPCLRRSQLRPVSRLPPAAWRKVRRGWKVLGRLQRRRVRPYPCLRRSQLWPVSRLRPAAWRKVRPGLESAGAVAAEAGKAVSLSVQLSAAAGLALTPSRAAQGAAGLRMHIPVRRSQLAAIGAQPQLRAPARLALAGAATLSATPEHVKAALPGAATLVGGAVLTAETTRCLRAAANPQIAATLTAQALRLRSATSLLAGASLWAWELARISQGATALAGAGAVTASPRHIGQLQLLRAGTSALLASAQQITTASLAMRAHSATLATAYGRYRALTQHAGQSRLDAAALRYHRAQMSFAAAGLLQAHPIPADGSRHRRADVNRSLNSGTLAASVNGGALAPSRNGGIVLHTGPN